MADRADDVGSLFPVPEEHELPEDLRKLFAKARERLGFVPNVFRTFAFRPERLSAWFSHYRLLHEPTDGLSAADREMIAVVVSAAPWATRQYRQPLVALTTTAIISRSAAPSPSVGSWSIR